MMDTNFPSTYECKRLVEPARDILPHYYFPGGSTIGGRDGLLVEVRPRQGPPWFGTFAFGRIAQHGVSDVFSMPHPDQFCVVSKGEGYLVNSVKPTEWESIRATPIIDVRSVVAQGIIVFADYTTLVAYGKDGVQWKTQRLTWDNMKITEISDDYVIGEYWDIRTEAIANFVVDLSTGEQQGGVQGDHG